MSAPVTWWQRASPQFWSRWGPFPASQLLNPPVDYLWRGADWNTVLPPADRKVGVRMRWRWWCERLCAEGCACVCECGLELLNTGDEWPTFRPLVPLPRLVFERVDFVRRLPSVLLCHALSHELLIVFRQVFLKPSCGFHRPDRGDHKWMTASQGVSRRSNLSIHH